MASRQLAQTELDLSHRRFTAAELTSLAQRRDVTRVSLRSSNLDDAGLRRLLRAWPALTSLDLSSTKVTAATWKHVVRLPQLELLKIWAPITDRQLEAITQLPRLRDLTVSGKHLTDAGIAPLAKLRRLRQLSVMSARGVRGPGIAHLASLPLESLDLAGCALGPEAIAPLTKLRKLTSLWVPNCKRLGRAELIALLTAGVPVKHADGLEAAQLELAASTAARAPHRSFYLLDLCDNVGTAHYWSRHLSSDLAAIAREVRRFTRGGDPSTIRIELGVYEASELVARHALRPPKWKLPRVRALRGRALAPRESTAVVTPGEPPVVLRHGAND